VLDRVTGEMADVDRISSEEWAKGLVYTNISGFALMQDGTLILTDECGNFVYCPPDRFEVEWLTEW